MGSSTISVDEFQALEQKVLQTVELIKKEREARASAENERNASRGEVIVLQEKLSAAEEKLAVANEKLTATVEELNAASAAQAEVDSLQKEREAVKLRVEKMLAQMDELL